VTAVVADAVGGAPAVDAAAPRRAALALARVETVRMLRHPVTVVATLFLVVTWVSSWLLLGTSRYPVLQDLDRDSAIGMMILLGGAALVVGNLAVLRTHRDGTAGLSQVLILPDPARTVAHLLATVPLAGFGAVLIVARMVVLGVWTPAAGHPDPYELAVGPVSVLLLGALGVLLGRLTRSAVVAPLALLVMLADIVALEPLTNGGQTMWLAPQGGPAPAMPVPVSLLGRPAGAHLAYLVGVAGLLAVVAVLRAGGRGVRLAVAGLVALACTVAGGAAQLSAPDRAVVADRAAAVTHPSRYQTCREFDRVTYCTFAGFSPWVPAWNTVVQGVLAQVPATARTERLTVRQRVVILAFREESNENSENSAAAGSGPGGLLAAWRADDVAAGTPGAVGVPTQWGDSRSAASLAGRVAYRLITGRPGEAQAEEQGELSGATACGGAGVLVVWLAGQAGSQARAGLDDLVEDGDGQGGVAFDENELFPSVSVPGPEVEVATRALARPHADIAARVQRSWATLTTPSTTAAQAAEILGVPAPPTGAAC
jgi:hypothetical protein